MAKAPKLCFKKNLRYGLNVLKPVIIQFAE